MRPENREWIPFYNGSAPSTPVVVVEDGLYRLRVRACKLLDCSVWTTEIPVIVQLTFPEYLTGTCHASQEAVPPQEPVGAVEGEASVAGGSGSYRIPIVAPPGRRGMQPSLALSYDSRGGSGHVGLGWSLGGISRVSRCPATVAQDGYVRAPAFDDADQLCLDGQRLMLVSQPSSTVREYRTEIESFQRIRLFGALTSLGSYFEVRSKEGGVRYFGAYRDSSALEVASVRQVPAAWWIRRAEDLQGNTVDYFYTASGDDFRLDRVHYTGTDAALGDRKIQLTYASRSLSGMALPDEPVSYTRGEVSRIVHRLTNISTWVGSRQVREYRLTQVPSRGTGRLLLASIEECAGGVCLRPSTFDYQDAPLSYVEEVLEKGEGVQLMLGSDYDGDGTRDLLRRVTAEPWGGETLEAQLLLSGAEPGTAEELTGSTWDVSFDRVLQGAWGSSDVDGDGAADQLGIVGGKFAIFGGTPTPSTKQSNLSIPALSYYFKMADFSGDGRGDLLYSDDAGQPRIYVQLATAPAGFALGFDTVGIPYAIPADTNITQVEDFDGDGAPDAFVDWNGGGAPPTQRVPQLEPQIIFTRRGPGGALTFETVPLAQLGAPAGSFRQHSGRRFADINGDGQLDIYQPDKTVAAGIRVWINTGGAFQERLVVGATNIDADHYDDLISFDVDADGRTDLLAPDKSRAPRNPWCYLTGSDSAEPKEYCSTPGHTINFDTERAPDQHDHTVYYWKALRFAENSAGKIEVREDPTPLALPKGRTKVDDHFGDGLSDLTFRLGSAYGETGGGTAQLGGYVPAIELGYFVLRNRGPIPDKMVRASNGFGVRAEWEYQPLSSDGSTSCPTTNRTAFYEVNRADTPDADHFFF
ncbi:FG-GAP-like repeat-containing protein, partial [Myxococcota bacterium]|nr:FG-GAP-like repeat-containing protein [Myxococcota bacterium]